MNKVNSCAPSYRLAFCFAALILCVPYAIAAAPFTIIDPTDAPLIASDGTAFVVTSGRMRVPELRTEPEGASIELAVVRIRRAGAGAGPAHVMLAGGPGDSGVRLALDLAKQGGAALEGYMDGDLVGIDQRGTGASTPNLRSPLRYGLPLDRAGSVSTWLPLMEAAARTVAADMRGRGIRLEAYNTEESADDIDAVRQALGYAKVTLWGRSYGSHLALATARRHPGAIERMILVSPEGPDHTWKLPSQVDLVLRRVSERAVAPAMLAQLRDAIAQLEHKPVQVALRDPATERAVDIVIGPFDVQWVIAQVIGDPRALATLPAAIAEMSAGNFQRVAQLSLLFRTRLGIDSVMRHIMDLSSGASAARSARIEREVGGALLGDTMNFPGRYLGGAWGVRALGDSFRQPVTGAIPVLILVGDLDARTPLENGQEIAATLTQAQVLVVENGAHQFDVFGNPALRALLGRFVRNERVASVRIVLPPLRFEKVHLISTETP